MAESVTTHHVVWIVVFMLAAAIAGATPPGIAKGPTTAKCMNEKYKTCHNLEHVCPKFCPDGCTVDCRSCKPICIGSTAPPSDSDSPPQSGSPPESEPPRPKSPPESEPPKPKSPPDSEPPKPKSPPDSESPKPKSPPKSEPPNPKSPPDSESPKPKSPPDSESPTPNPKSPPEPESPPEFETSPESRLPPPSLPYPPRATTPSPSPPPPSNTPSNPTGPPNSNTPSSSPTPPTPTPSSPSPPSTTPSSPSPAPPTPTPSFPSPPSTTPSSPSTSPPTPIPSSPSPPQTPTPSSSPPTWSSPPSSTPSTSPKKAKCKNKNYPLCYTREHVCPNSCPGGCEVDCVSCKPVCKCDMPGAVCQDPRFVGGDGITFYFHGKKDQDFCLVSDTNLHINGHFIGRRNLYMKRDFTWVQSIAILFGNRKLVIGAQKTSSWDDSIDRLTITLNQKPILLQEIEGAKWQSQTIPRTTISRTSETNNVLVEVEGLFKITAKVVPITKKESRVHNYGITEDDCFAHLDLGFKFFSLSDEVNGVLGQTYKSDYVSQVKMGVLMPVMGGDRKFSSSSLFATDCSVARFKGSGHGYGGEASSMSLELPSLSCTSGFGGQAGVACKR